MVVTAGGTREPIDPVRFLGNRSSGKQGYAFATTALARGAEVTLIAANVSLPDPAGATIVRVGSTEELRVATLDAAGAADAVIMAAAPADFRPAEYHDQKIKKSDGDAPTLRLVANPDIAAELGVGKPVGQVLVTFAAETTEMGAAIDAGLAKMRRKRADLTVVNQVGVNRTFGADRNAAVVLAVDGARVTLGDQTKQELADAVWDLVVARMGAAR